MMLTAAQRTLDDPDMPEVGIICPGCGWRIYPGANRLRADARHCSPTCRQRDYRQRHGATPDPRKQGGRRARR